MGEAIAVVLPYAIGVAISPLPIIAVILVLFSARAHVNGPVFLAGWVLGVAVVSVAVYLLSDASDASTDDTTSDSVSWIKLLLGVWLVLLAVRKLRARRARRRRRSQVDGVDRFAHTGQGRGPGRR